MRTESRVRKGVRVEVAASASEFRFDPGARFPRFIGAPRDAAKRVGDLRVAVVGAGAVGGRVVDHVARLGVASLTVVDRGRFKPASVVTQAVLPEDVGASKASWSAARARAVNPSMDVVAFDGPVERLPADAFRDADVVFLATDNLAAEVETGQRCVRFGRRLIQGAVHGESLTAEVRVFEGGEGGPCPACGFSADEWSQLDRGTRYACDPEVDWRDASPAGAADAVPTTSVSALCALAADMAVMQMLRSVLTLGRPVAHRVVTHCGYTDQIRTAPMRRNPACRADHRRLVHRALRALSRESLAGLARRAEVVAPGLVAAETAAFAVDGRRFVARARCRCGAEAAPMRFLGSDASAGACDACGGMLETQPYFAHAPVARAIAAPVIDEPLADLVRGPMTGITVWGDGGGVRFEEER